MTSRRPFFAACCIAATALCLSVSACTSNETQAREYYAEYQVAVAAGDLVAARTALLKTVAVQDDVPAYWEQLGKIQVELGELNGAYEAFKRAHELDRSNSQILANLTQLALMSGEIDLAEEHARDLELISGETPAVNLAYGYAALQRQDLDEADQHADKLIEALPYEPSAKLLKARILVTRHKNGEAIALLENQLKARPDDKNTWKALMALHERNENWKAVAEAAARVASLDPTDESTRLLAVDAALRQKDISAAMRGARPFLSPQAPGESVDSVLLLWAERWKSPQAVETARKFSAAAGPQQKLAYASYFNEVGKPGYTAEIVGSEPILPITLANSATNAIIADAMAQSGRATEAMRLFNAILEKEPDHVYALRARINLEIRAGKALAAVSDAQRLVSVMPKSARDRLLLARAYDAARDRRQLDRTLWDAFHEIPGNRDLYEALRAHVEKYDGPDAARRVDDEYEHQKDVGLVREFI
jgi:predicted Zn-dependent protease